jgi:ketol-acid reductoisomerase
MVARRKVNSNPSRKQAGDKVVAVIGYGSQGRAVARNLSDSGYSVVIGLRAGSKSKVRAKKDTQAPILSIPAAVRKADIICFAFPDHLHSRVFKRSIKANLRRSATLWFLHASSTHFGLVMPPKGCDVVLVAPHAPGDAVREAYVTDRSLSAFYGVWQNRSKQAGHTARKLAAAIGVKRQNLIKTTFQREAVGDLFGEQAVLCGGLAMLIKHGFETLVDHGWKPDNAYLEVAYQLDLIVALIKKHGIAGMLLRVSPAARLGSLEAGPKIIDQSVRERMEEQFERINSGAFAAQLENLDDKALASLKRALSKLTDPRLEKAARKFSR